MRLNRYLRLSDEERRIHNAWRSEKRRRKRHEERGELYTPKTYAEVVATINNPDLPPPPHRKKRKSIIIDICNELLAKASEQSCQQSD